MVYSDDFRQARFTAVLQAGACPDVLCSTPHDRHGVGGALAPAGHSPPPHARRHSPPPAPRHPPPASRPKPDTLKLRKRVKAWPLEFTFKASSARRAAGRGWSRPQRQHAACCTQLLSRASAAGLLTPGPSMHPPAAFHLPLQADYHTESREFTYGMMCRVSWPPGGPVCPHSAPLSSLPVCVFLWRLYPPLSS